MSIRVNNYVPTKVQYVNTVEEVQLIDYVKGYDVRLPRTIQMHKFRLGIKNDVGVLLLNEVLLNKNSKYVFKDEDGNDKVKGGGIFVSGLPTMFFNITSNEGGICFKEISFPYKSYWVEIEERFMKDRNENLLTVKRKLSNELQRYFKEKSIDGFVTFDGVTNEGIKNFKISREQVNVLVDFLRDENDLVEKYGEQVVKSIIGNIEESVDNVEQTVLKYECDLLEDLWKNDRECQDMFTYVWERLDEENVSCDKVTNDVRICYFEKAFNLIKKFEQKVLQFAQTIENELK